MDLDIVIGVTLTILALGAVIFMTFWSRHIIERINSESPGSLREIQKEKINGNRT